MATIFIKDLLLRTEVGFNPHELGKKQDLVLNVSIHYETQGEENSDNPMDALNYRDICKNIIVLVEGRQFNLLERVANEVAGLILAMPRVDEVEVEVDKPHALRFANSVSFRLVKKNRKMTNEAIVGLGSNIDPQQNISGALSFLQKKFEVLKEAGPIKTSPVGIINQSDFFNAAVLLRTDLALDELIRFLKKLEDDMGRDRSRSKYGPREIDLDVIIWNKDVVDQDFYEREFLRQLVKDLGL